MNKIVELLKSSEISDIRNYLNEKYKHFINNKKELEYIDFMYGIDQSKLSDYGIDQSTLFSITGTIFTMAPEVLKDEKELINSKTDI